MNEATTAPTRRKLDVGAYERMSTAGILRRTDRVELIDGALIDMAPIGQVHAAIVGTLGTALFRACGDGALVWVQNPLWIDRFNVPQPDFSVFRRRADRYFGPPRPGPADTLLVVEVADTSLQYDRTVKLPLYAAAGIPEYWVVDLQAQTVETHRRPEGGRYAETEKHGPGERIALAAMPEIVVPLDVPFG